MKNMLKAIGAVTIAVGLMAGSYVSAVANEINVEVNQTQVVFTNAQPVIQNGSTLVPVRGVFEELGFTITWDSATSTGTLTRNQDTITVTTGDEAITVNNQRIYPEPPPQLISGSFMLPLRAVAEATGATVEWESQTRTAVITSVVSLPPAVPIWNPEPSPVEVTPLPEVNTPTASQIFDSTFSVKEM